MRKSQISASMMCSNLVDLQATIDVFEKEKVEYLHIDVMDGEFARLPRAVRLQAVPRDQPGDTDRADRGSA